MQNFNCFLRLKWQKCLSKVQFLVVSQNLNLKSKMRPYRRTKKPIRYCEYDKGYTVWLGRASKATDSLIRDIQTIWFREPPFPASVRILMSLVLTCMLVMPLFYFLVPPILTIFSLLLLKCENFPNCICLPPLPALERKILAKAYKDLFKKATFRLSMFVTCYDYVQTFRALGGFNFSI